MAAQLGKYCDWHWCEVNSDVKVKASKAFADVLNGLVDSEHVIGRLVKLPIGRRRLWYKVMSWTGGSSHWVLQLEHAGLDHPCLVCYLWEKKVVTRKPAKKHITKKPASRT